MEIIIGSIPPVPTHANKRQDKSGSMIEAKLLHVRPPRRGIAGPSGMERRGKKAKDPHNGKVLTIMVPDGDLLPSDLEESNYNVYLRLVRK